VRNPSPTTIISRKNPKKNITELIAPL